MHRTFAAVLGATALLISGSAMAGKINKDSLACTKIGIYTKALNLQASGDSSANDYIAQQQSAGVCKMLSAGTVVSLTTDSPNAGASCVKPEGAESCFWTRNTNYSR